ncbi:MAG: hypothetical protein ACAH07_06170 [Methylophilaceae bacterium]|nr:hypothetical protein [Methyloradius sp.]
MFSFIDTIAGLMAFGGLCYYLMRIYEAKFKYGGFEKIPKNIENNIKAYGSIPVCVACVIKGVLLILAGLLGSFPHIFLGILLVVVGGFLLKRSIGFLNVSNP